MRFFITIFISCFVIQIILSPGICSAQEETSEDNIRLANGAPVEGNFKSAAPEGLTVQSAKGTKTLPWKYLSTGTRWRYERPMLADLKAKKLKAEKAAKAKAEAAAKAAAAAATNKQIAAAANTNQPKTTDLIPGVVVSNKPAAK